MEPPNRTCGNENLTPFLKKHGTILVFTRKTACPPVHGLEVCVMTGRQGKPICAHIGMVLAHGRSPETANKKNLSD